MSEGKGPTWEVTIKRPLTSSEETFTFADPKFISKDMTLEGDITYVKRPSNQIHPPAGAFQ